jgi:ribonuclease-3
LPQQHNNYVYGNALEALIGAIYLDKGYKQCRRFMLDRVFARLDNIDSVVRADKNYKSRLIEWAQKNHRVVEFRLVREELLKEGPFFVTDVVVDDAMCGTGTGFSKRESQQKAAKQAILKLGIE